MNKKIFFLILTLSACTDKETTIIYQPLGEQPKPEAVHKRQYLSGDKLVCIYSRMGKEEQVILSRNDICPLRQK